MVLAIEESGSSTLTCDKATAFRSGLMDQNTKGGGRIAKPMEEEDSFMQMETCSRESGKMIRLMEEESILTLMGQSMKELGKKIDRMEMELRHGLTALAILVSIRWERSMDMESSNGLMDLHTMDSSLKTIFTVKECMNGLTGEGSKVTGRTIKWTEEECSIGLIKGVMRANTLMTRRRGRATSSGPMVDST